MTAMPITPVLPHADPGHYARIGDALDGASPDEVVAWAIDAFPGSVSLGTGFGLEGMALLDIALRVDPHIDVFFLDTAFLFPETYELRRRVERHYGIEIRAVEPSLTADEQAEVLGPELWRREPDRCCAIRKVEPLGRALVGRSAWLTAIRRDQTPARASARVVEWDSRREVVKVSPLLGWARSDVWEYVLENGVPFNPLLQRGYPSIGCTHCTKPVRQGDDERAGRWAGFEKTECGLHREGDR